MRVEKTTDPEKLEIAEDDEPTPRAKPVAEGPRDRWIFDPASLRLGRGCLRFDLRRHSGKQRQQENDPPAPDTHKKRESTIGRLPG